MTTAASLEKPLPRQIRDRVQRGQEILDALDAPPNGEQTIDTPPPSDDVTTPPTPPAETTTTPPDGDLQPYRDPKLATDPRANDPNYWRHRFSVLQGKLEEERRNADSRDAAHREKIADLEAQIRALKAGSAPAPDLKTLLRPEQIEALGEDQATTLVQTAVAAAQSHVDQVLAAQRAEEEARRASEQETAQQRQQRAFIDALDEAAPNWREIDARQDWRDWLGQIDPRTGNTRQSALDIAKSHADARAIAATVNTFVQTLAPRAQPPVAPPAGPGVPATPTPPAARDLSQVPPTPAEIQEHYRLCSINRGRNYPEEKRLAFEKRLQLL